MMPFTTNQYQLQHFDREYFGDLGEAEYLKSKPKQLHISYQPKIGIYAI